MATLKLRSFAGPADYPIITELANANFALAEFPAIVLEDETRNEFEHLEHCDPYKDMALAEDDAGHPLGYARISWIDDLEGLRRYQFNLSVSREGEGLGAASTLLDWAIERVHGLTDLNQTDRRTVMQTWVIDEKTQAARLSTLTKAGFTPIRYGYFMLRDLSEPIEVSDLPDGLYTRPCTPDDDRPIFDALHDAFRDHWGYAPPPDMDADFDEFRSWPLRNPALYKVAFAKDENGREQVAGMVLNFVAEEDNKAFGFKRGWCDPICVRRPWRKRGVARGLIMRSLRMFADMGMTEAALGVDTENMSGALRVYESCGFKVNSRSVTMRKQM